MPIILVLAKVTLLLAAALVVTLVMPRASAGSRHVIWLVVLGALLIVPLFATWQPLAWRVLPETLGGPAVPSAVVRSHLGDATLTPAPAGTPLPQATESVRGTEGATAPATSFNVVAYVMEHLTTTLLAAWLCVAVLLAGWLAYGVFSVRRIVRRASPLVHPDWQGPLYEIADRLGLDDAPRLVRSADVKMPFASGLVRCTIVLPAECDEWSADRRSAVLIHELGHVRRHDLVGHTLGRVACALYWFHPMVWTAARRLRAESERACDDLALKFGARPSEYAEHLLDIVTCVRDHATPSVALAMAHRKEFEGRMLAILNPELRRSGLGRLQTASLVATLSLVIVAITAAAPARPAVPENQVANNVPNVAPHDAPSLPIDSPRNGTVRTHTSTRVEQHTRTDFEMDTQITHALAKVHVNVGPRAEADSSSRAALLVQLLRTDTAASVRRIAAWGLSRYTDQGDVRRALATALSGDADASVREMSAWALADADTVAVAALSKAALGDKAERVREMATWGLGNSGETAAAATITEVLANETSRRVRGTAAWAIGQFDVKRAPKGLLTALTDSSADVRLKAAWAAGQIGDSAALVPLRAALRRETSPEARRAQLRALLNSGEDPAGMVEWLKSPDKDTREMAARALAGAEATSPWPWPWPRPMPGPMLEP